MWIKTDAIVGITEASNNLYSAFKVADEHGAAVVMKNNRPVYVIYTPNRFLNTDNIKARIAIREATRSFSSMAYKIYDSGCVLVTRRNKPAYVIFDYKIIKNTPLETIPIVLRKELGDA